MIDSLDNVLTLILVLMGISLTVALIGLFALVRSIRQLHVPSDADFFTTMHYIPLTLVVLLDLLDFGLDIFAAPISWAILSRMGLYGLRNKAAIEALIPFTQPIPTFTIGWLAARLLNLGDYPGARRSIGYDDWEATPRPQSRRPTIIDMDDR